ncbi:MAG TPA: TIGR03435 family protein [Bryobacteraceae bacterium]|nr:TIGR03435 family protein [Bryobacteraceae bacterium]
MNRACMVALRSLAVAAWIGGGEAQTTMARVAPRNFEVASIRPNQAGGDSRGITTLPGGLFKATNVSLRLLISRAYGLPEAQIEGGPGWLDSETYDINAKADTPLEMTREEARPSLQALLAERFRLRMHHESKQGAIYSLVVAKGGAKFKEHAGEGRSAISSSTGSGKAAIEGRKTTMVRLVEYLSAQAGRLVVDNTGLHGEYDFRVEWTTDEARDAPGPSIFTALQEQLGLKLDATKGPIDFIVIDQAEKASAN